MLKTKGRKQIVTFSIFLFFNFIVNNSNFYAQSFRNQIAIAGDVSYSVGYFGQFTSVGYGGMIKGLYGLTKSSQLGVSSAFIYFPYKANNKERQLSNSFIPIFVSYKQKFAQQFYVEPHIGLTIVLDRAIIKNQEEEYPYSTISSGTNTDNGLGWAVALGYETSFGLDLSVRYEGAQHGFDILNKKEIYMGFIALRVGYNFLIKNKKE